MRRVGVVRGDIGRARRDGDWDAKIHTLPARGRLAGEGHRGQQCSRTGPQIADVGAGVIGAFIEADFGSDSRRTHSPYAT